MCPDQLWTSCGPAVVCSRPAHVPMDGRAERGRPVPINLSSKATPGWFLGKENKRTSGVKPTQG